MKQPTAIEVAQLRLACWKAIKTWGAKDDTGTHKNWDWPTRKDRARDLADWALEGTKNPPRKVKR